MHVKRHCATGPYPTESSSVSTLASAEYCGIQSSDHEMESEANESTAELGSVYEPVSIQAVQEIISDFILVLKSKNVCQGVVNIISSLAQPRKVDTLCHCALCQLGA